MRIILLFTLFLSAVAMLGQDNIQGDLIPGCIDSMACNYDSSAEFEDGSCEFDSCSGCTNSEAINFDSEATIDNGLCLFEDLCGQVFGDDMIINDFTGHYAPGLWDIHLGGNGTVDITTSQIYIVGIDEDPEATDALTQTTISVVSNGTVTFSWNFTTEDEDGSGFDLGYYINGTRYDLVDASGDITQIGVVAIEVTTGDLLGFGVDEIDGCCGGGFLTITNFTAEVADCIVGCMDSGACNFDDIATIDDDSCDFESCLGCTDSEAMNYDSTSTIDDASCLYIDPCGTISDVDGNGADFVGHYDSFQWNLFAASDGTIEIEETYIHIIGGNAEDEEGEGEGLAVDGGGESESLTQASRTAAATGSYTFNWSYSTEDEPEFDIAYYLNGIRYDLILMDGEPIQVGAISFEAVEGDIIGFGIDSTDDCCGVGELTITDFTYPLGDCDMGCTDEESCNYDSSANYNDLSCEYESCYGCLETSACNYDSSATINDDSCEFGSCAGCTEMEACNYDSSATIDDDSCEFDSCAGCTDMEACNYDSSATIDDDSCEFDSCAGCTDMEACNYDSSATIDDDSCEYESCAGCTDSGALNYDSTATIDDGSCFDECEFPTLEFVAYCEDGDQDNFYVELTVSGTSNAFPFTINNDVNASIENGSMAGVNNLGAFENNTFVEFTVTSDEYGCTVTSEMLSGNCLIDSVDELDIPELSIYPNPTNGNFTIADALTDHTLTIEIMNNLGQLVFAQEASSNEQGVFNINALDQLADGNYMARVSQGNQIQVARIIVQK
jgi:hypothetical protein